MTGQSVSSKAAPPDAMADIWDTFAGNGLPHPTTVPSLLTARAYDSPAAMATTLLKLAGAEAGESTTKPLLRSAIARVRQPAILTTSFNPAKGFEEPQATTVPSLFSARLAVD